LLSATAGTLLTLVMSGCVLMGGSKMVVIRGALPESAGTCLLDFVVADGGRVKMRQPVEGDFVVRVVVSGGFAQNYYFLARCQDQHAYRSREAVIGMSDDDITIEFSRFP
jgi:hypothetical protein